MRICCELTIQAFAFQSSTKRQSSAFHNSSTAIDPRNRATYSAHAKAQAGDECGDCQRTTVIGIVGALGNMKDISGNKPRRCSGYSSQCLGDILKLQISFGDFFGIDDFEEVPKHRRSEDERVKICTRKFSAMGIHPAPLTLISLYLGYNTLQCDTYPPIHGPISQSPYVF